MLTLQVSEFDRLNFHATAGCPYPFDFNKTNKRGEELSSILWGRIDYVSGNATVSDLNIKPVSLSLTSTDIFGDVPITASLGADVGYNINFMHGNNGIVVSPNLYLDYSIIYMKFGYDYNASHNEGGLFLRFGLSFGTGALKQFEMLTR